MIALPQPRGAVTELLLDALPGPVRPLRATPEPGDDEDLQLALYLCYELHYRGLPGVDDRWEWEPSLLALRGELERRFEADLRRDVPVPAPRRMPWTSPCAAIVDADDAPSLSQHLERRGTLEQFLEFVDPPLGLPAQGGRPALVGAPAAQRTARRRRWWRSRPTSTAAAIRDRIHAQLFADAMDALGLDSPLRRLRRPPPRRHARDRQPDVDVRAAPPPARARSSATWRCSR